MSCFQLEPRGDALQTVQQHLPRGEAWHAFRIAGKVAYRLFQAFSDAYEDMSKALCRLVEELNPYSTTQLISEWETAVGLPDPCLPTTTTLEERRAQVVFRLTKKRWTSEQDWKDLALLFGLEITVTPGWHVQKPALYPFCYPKTYIYLERLGRFHVYIDIIDGCGDTGYVYSYPIPYGNSARCDAFICLINRVKPANVVVIWNNTPPIPC